MINLLLEPVDTLFFRDGTPFSAGSASQEDVGGLFPPHPTTLTGALRAALARCNGWSGQGRWSRELNELLGKGPEDLGRVSFEGPFVIADGKPLFRAPRHLLGTIEEQPGKTGEPDRTWIPRILLRPGPEVACDLGDTVRLPDAPQSDIAIEKLVAGKDCWLTRVGMETVMRGELPVPTEVVPTTKLWSEERRIGIERDRSTRTAKKGMLYSTRHVRLKREVALGVRIGGIPEGWTPPFDRMIPLGGESRMAHCRPWDGDLALDAPLAAIEASGRLVVIALTPLDLDASATPLADLGNARVMSACLSRPQRIGGWDSLSHRPLPLRSLLPAGSVLFCEIDDPQRFRGALGGSEGLPQLGSRQRWGFGAVALGLWPDESEVKA